MSAIVESAGNLVFELIMNSVRELYMPRTKAFRGIVRDRDALISLYELAARAIEEADPQAAANAVEQLAAAQEQRITAR
jgi:DNA-binding FadR family transcriptional regulator